MKKITGTLGLLILLLALAASCGGSKVTPEPDPESGNPGVVKTPPPGATTVQVQLTEWAVVPDETAVQGGPVYFLATNSGAEKHELVVVKSDLAPGDLPVTDEGKVDEDKVDVIGEIEGFAAGSQASDTFDLEPGNYVLVCNIVQEDNGQTVSHYKQGMRTAFTVQ